MTLIVEDGTIVANANTYVDSTDLEAFAVARGITLEINSEQLLIQAMDYIEGLYFKGVKRQYNQPLQWPRYNVWVDGFYIMSDTIPQQLKDGLCQCAIAIDQGNSPLQDIVRNTKREKVGDLEIEYASNSVSVPINVKISNSLKKLLASGGGVLNVTKG